MTLRGPALTRNGAAGTTGLAGEPRFPTWGDHWGDAEVIEAGPVEAQTGLGQGRCRTGRPGANAWCWRRSVPAPSHCRR